VSFSTHSPQCDIEDKEDLDEGLTGRVKQ
jgi:hypothetical protein